MLTDNSAAKPLARGLQHVGREVHAYGSNLTMPAARQLLSYQRQQTSVAGSNVENAPRRRRNKLEQSRFSFPPMRELVGTPEIILNMLR
jgi:hypothetical protein